MLKIKDNVDLKELEKFGFYKVNESEYEVWAYDVKKECSFTENGFAMIEVQEFDFDHRPDRILGLFTTTDDEVWWNIDVVYDLIQAGLVEKVV